MRAVSASERLGVTERYFVLSNNSAPPLRIGLMLDGPELPGPHAGVVELIERSNFAAIVAHIYPVRDRTKATELPKLSVLVRLWRMLNHERTRRRVLFSAFEKWDARAHPDSAGVFELKNVQQNCTGLKIVHVSAKRAGFIDRFTTEDVARLRDLQLDVLLRFGFGILRGDILNCARFGVWSFHHGDNTHYRGSPPQFWEMFERSDITGALLQVLNESLDNGLVLGKVHTALFPGMSLLVNRVAPYLTAQPLVIQKLKRLHEAGWKTVCAEAVPDEPYCGKRPLYRAPNNLEMLRFAGHHIQRRIRNRVLRTIKRDADHCQWRVGVRARRAGHPWEGKWDGWRWVTAPAGHYYADPMLWDEGGRTFLFVEDYIIAEKRGIIAVAEVGGDGEVGSFGTALALPYHLSFPHIFSRDDARFMIPETKACARVEVFRCVSFPFDWRPERVLLNVEGVDTVLHKGRDGREYLFTSVAHRPGAQVALYLFHADSIWGEWRIHSLSPLSVDVRISRNGGSILMEPGIGPVRISQDNTGLYGRQMHFHRVAALSAQDYGEEAIGTRSTAGIVRALGTHTYSRSERFEATDVFGW